MLTRTFVVRGAIFIFFLGAFCRQTSYLFFADLLKLQVVGAVDDEALPHDDVANDNTANLACNMTSSVWRLLCEAGFIERAESILNVPGRHMSIVQIGAHTGWDYNDPFVGGITTFLQSLSQERRNRVDYLMVEASPVNFAVLQKKIQVHKELCNLKALWAGVVPDNAQESSDNLTFYGISSDINVDTGRDYRSGKKLPIWASQLSSFSKQNILKHRRHWERQGLDLEDYIEEMNVKTIRFSDLISTETYFMLIDTEGLDCDIVRAMSNSSMLPPFILYEHKHCGQYQARLAKEHLGTLGYEVNVIDRENALASRS